jgi:AbrB family looped-hinge helix DNA binding protein
MWAALAKWYNINMAHKKAMAPIEHYSVRLGNRGRVVLPSKLRQKLRLQDGDRLLLTVQEDGTVRLVSARDVVERTAGCWKHLAPPGVSMADELIRQRREEARREAKKFGW